jgi:hypothetical protein
MCKNISTNNILYKNLDVSTPITTEVILPKDMVIFIPEDSFAKERGLKCQQVELSSRGL